MASAGGQTARRRGRRRRGGVVDVGAFASTRREVSVPNGPWPAGFGRRKRATASDDAADAGADAAATETAAHYFGIWRVVVIAGVPSA